jgi:uncharacterized protein YjbJ (UPF0337 family)
MHTKNTTSQNNNQVTLMNTLEMTGNWNILKGKLKQKWAKLTDDDLEFVEGKEDELVGRIQKRTGGARKGVEQPVDEACSSCCWHKSSLFAQAESPHGQAQESGKVQPVGRSHAA